MGGYSNRKAGKLDSALRMYVWCYVFDGGWGGNKSN